MRDLFLAALLFVVGIIIAEPAAAQGGQYHYVTNTRPPDPFLSLRTHPSANVGQRLAKMPNGTLLEVLERRNDGWWFVRVIPTSQEGWALNGEGGLIWIACCAASTQQVVSPGSLGFRTPSNNIHCMIDDFGVNEGRYPPFLRCDIYKIDNRPPPKPRSCQDDWGHVFSIAADDPIGQRLCASDAIISEQWPVLAYGAVWQQQGFTCTSEQTGLTCFNAKRHGFTLSRSGQKLF